jgi:hypothetical protein
MNLGQEWSHDPAEPLDGEEQMLVDYFDARSGLMFTDVDVTAPAPESRPRELDLLRIPDPPVSRSKESIYLYGTGNQSFLQTLVENHTVELVEIAPWGFDALGQLLGKAEIFRQEWRPENIQLRLLLNSSGPNPYSPERDPDPAAEAVFEKYGVNLFHRYHGFIDWDDSK